MIYQVTLHYRNQNLLSIFGGNCIDINMQSKIITFGFVTDDERDARARAFEQCGGKDNAIACSINRCGGAR